MHANAVLYIIFFFIVRVGAMDVAEAVKQLQSVGCKSVYDVERVKEFLEENYTVKAKKNPFAHSFETPLTLPDVSKEGSDVQFTVYRLGKGSEAESDAEIVFLVKKLGRFGILQKKLGNLSELGVQRVFGCYYKQKKKGLTRKLAEISHVVVEEERLGTLVRAPIAEWNQFAYLVDQMVQTYARLEARAVVFGTLSVDDFWIKKLSGNFFKVLVKWERAGFGFEDDPVAAFQKRMTKLNHRYLYQYPGTIISSYLEAEDIHKNEFSAFYGRWMFALAILELSGVDLVRAFASPQCSSIQADYGCISHFKDMAQRNLRSRYPTGPSYAAISALGKLIDTLTYHTLRGEMSDIAATFSQRFHSE